MLDVAILLVFFVAFPLLFSIGVFILGFKVAKKFDFWKSVLLIALTFTIAFYFFRLFYVILGSITSLYDEFPPWNKSFISNLGHFYSIIFSFVDTGESLKYVFRRFGIHLPGVLYQNWLGVSVMEVLFYLFVGIIVSIAAKLWAGKSSAKIGAALLLLAAIVFYLFVTVYWMSLAI